LYRETMILEMGSDAADFHFSHDHWFTFFVAACWSDEQTEILINIPQFCKTDSMTSNSTVSVSGLVMCLTNWFACSALPNSVHQSFKASTRSPICNTPHLNKEKIMQILILQTFIGYNK
ncbi:hypothetical protein T02_7956, partial [Trichinella nativa]